MLKQLFLLSAGFLLATTGCGGLVEHDEMSLGSDTKELGRPAQHCVARALTLPKDQPVPQNLEQTRYDCFDTYADAISFVSKGSVQLPANAKPQDLKQEHVDQMATMAVYVIAKEYEATFFGGYSLTVHAEAPCQPGTFAALSSMPYGWDNRISSAEAFAGCNFSVHYEHTRWSGASLDCGTSCASLGLMNKNTSSIKWFY